MYMALLIFTILLTCMFIPAGVLIVCSPGKAKPFLDYRGKPMAGSISEKIHVNINGVDQGMFIKGVYFFHGIYDYTASYTLAKKYFKMLHAPLKGFYTFEQSAHSPLFEEPEKIQNIMLKDILAGANNLADSI